MPAKIQYRTIEGGLLEITGRTFDIKDKLKQLGCRWRNSTKSWVVGDRAALRSTLEKLISVPLKKQRLCGFCRKPGHNQGSCNEKRTQDLAQQCRKGPGPKYMRLKITGYCECTYAPLPETCFNCRHWCCIFAKPLPQKLDIFTAFSCVEHGTGTEQHLNDTRGT